MKWIIITSPETFSGEVAFIARLLDAGVDVIHLRKPGWDAEEYGTLISRIPDRYRDRIVVHDHFELCARYDLRGIHLNRRNHEAPPGFTGRISCSCHSLAEVEAKKPEMDYVFLSPIFDSVSKQGYSSQFSVIQLKEANRRGIIDHRVMALGGVTAENISIVRALHFGGVAMLGDIWSRAGGTGFESYLKRCEKAIRRSEEM